MTSSASSRETVRLKVDLVEVKLPWQTALLAVHSFPVPSFQLEPLRVFLRSFSETVVQQHHLHHEVLHQVWKLSPQTGANVLSENTTRWSPSLGMGIWPDRRPPQGWTEELMVDASAAVFRGDEPELPSHRLLRLTAPDKERMDAADKMRGFGVEIEFFSKDKFETIQQRGKEVFLPSITERRFQKEDFYLPLLDRRSVSAAASVEQLDSWMCGVDIYVRESAEDRGVMVISRLPLEPLLEQTRQRLDRLPTG